MTNSLRIFNGYRPEEQEDTISKEEDSKCISDFRSDLFIQLIDY